MIASQASTAIFMCLSTELTMDRNALDAALEDIAGRGFEILFIEFRDSVWEPLDGPAVEAGHYAVAKAKELGLGVWVQLVPDCVSGSPTYFARRWPDQMQEVINSYETTLEGGVARVELHKDRRFGKAYKGAARVFYPLPSGGVCDVTEHISTEFMAEPDFSAGIIAPRKHYGFGLLTLTAEGVPDGPLWVYTRWNVGAAEWPRFFDYTRDGWKQLGEDILDLYGDMDIDGIGWDEFGASCTWMHPKAFGAMTQSYLDRFKRTYGYDLADHYYALDHDVAGENCALVRRHHWKLMAELHHEVLGYWRSRSKAVYGKPDLEMGIHQTLHETSCDDLYLGSLDLFGAAEVQSGGFTDSVFMREDSMLYHITLARSLGYVGDKKVAWNNSWNFAPTDDQIDYYTRVMAMSRVGWLAHLYGESPSFGPGYPDHPTWARMNEHTSRLREVNTLLGGARPDADIALVYTWESCGSVGDYDYMHIHRSSDMQAIKKLLLGGYGVDVVGIPHLESASSGDARIEINGRRYSTLLIPWADMLPQSAWASIRGFADAGGRILFWGPPPVQDNAGNCVESKFSALVGATAVREGAYADQPLNGEVISALGRGYSYDADSDEPEFFCQLHHYYPHPRVYELKLREGQHLASFGTMCCGVRNGNVAYLAAEPPVCGALLVDLLKEMGAMPEMELPQGSIGRRLTDEATGATFICVAGRHNQAVSGPVRCGEHDFNIPDRRFVLLRIDGQSLDLVYEEGGEMPGRWIRL